MFEFIPIALLPVLIFFVRVADMSLDTLRVLFVVRGRRPHAWIVGFVQSALWVIAVASVLSHLDNLLNVLAYAAGFATGNVVGMRIEAVAGAVRSAGYAVTELSGKGKDGAVSILTTSVRRRDIDPVRNEVLQADPDAFVTLSDVRPLHRGFWRA